MRIGSKLDMSKVAVLYNTNYSESLTLANEYAALRGISLVDGFDFGTNDQCCNTDAERNAYSSGVLADVSSYISLNNLDAIILSINCPSRYFHDPTSGAAVYLKYTAFCWAIANANHISTTGSRAAGKHIFETCHSDSPGASTVNVGGIEGVHEKVWRSRLIKNQISHLTTPSSVPVVIAGDWDEAYSRGGIFCGRLGHQGSIGGSELDRTRQQIEDALWYEENGDPANSPMMFGFATRSVADHDMTYGTIWDAWQMARPLMNNIKSYTGDSQDDPNRQYESHNWPFPKPAVTIKDTVSWMAGNGPVEDIWGWVGYGAINQRLYATSVRYARGAWQYEATSSGVSDVCLKNGGCAAIIPVYEPTTWGIPDVSRFFGLLMRGYTFLEAQFMASRFIPYNLASWPQAQAAESRGDPLYRPFKNFKYGRASGITRGESEA